MERFRSNSEVDRRYQEARAVFGPYEIPELDREHTLTALERSRFTQAYAIAESRKYAVNGQVSDQVRRFVDTQNKTKSSESVGTPFSNPVELTYNGYELVDQKGDSHRQSLRVATIGALAMAKRDPGYDFYARRTFYDYKFASDFEQMVRDETVPVGSVMGLVSPCEMEDQRHAISIGMSPSREMALVQYARKSSSKTLELITISLDRADLRLLRTLLASHGVELPAVVKAEDVLGYTFQAKAGTAGEFRSLIQQDIEAFDAELSKKTGKPMRQGQFVDEKNNPKDIPWNELQDIVDIQFAFDEALSWAAMPGGRDLHPHLRQHAEVALSTTRPDGRPLLNDHEQALLRRLLGKKSASLDDHGDAEAFLILKNIQDTAIDEIIRRRMAGGLETVHGLASDQEMQVTPGALIENRGAAASVRDVSVHDLIQVAAQAAQAGRFAGACGSYAEFGEGSGGTTPNVFAVGQMGSIVGMILRGEDTSFLVPDNASLTAKYGKENVHYGECDCCPYVGDLGPCDICNGCDTLDRMEPGYAQKAKARKQSKIAFANAV